MLLNGEQAKACYNLLSNFDELGIQKIILKTRQYRGHGF